MRERMVSYVFADFREQILSLSGFHSDELGDRRTIQTYAFTDATTLSHIRRCIHFFRETQAWSENSQMGWRWLFALLQTSGRWYV